jgi:hypothetical protein
VNGQIARSLDNDLEPLILSKFGKVEAEGRGLLDLVAMAIGRGIPVLIGVPIRNLEAWRNFAGDMSIESTSDPSDVMGWLNGSFPPAAAQTPEPVACQLIEPLQPRLQCCALRQHVSQQF